MLKHANTYEIITPESVGATGDLVLGKHSGKAAYKARLTPIPTLTLTPTLTLALAMALAMALALTLA